MADKIKIDRGAEFMALLKDPNSGISKNVTAQAESIEAMIANQSEYGTTSVLTAGLYSGSATALATGNLYAAGGAAILGVAKGYFRKKEADAQRKKAQKALREAKSEAVDNIRNQLLSEEIRAEHELEQSQKRYRTDARALNENIRLGVPKI